MIQSAADHPNTYQSFQLNPNSSFGYFNGAQNTFSNGVANSPLYLFRMVSSLYGGAGTNGQTGSLEGVFTISNTGVISFSAVPEPSTIALFAIAGGVYLLIRNRKRMSV